MFPTKSLIVYLTVALASTALVSADFHDASRRDHNELNRMIRKRAPQLGGILGIVGVGQLPPTTSPHTSPTGAAGAANAGADPASLSVSSVATSTDTSTTSATATGTTSATSTEALTSSTTSTTSSAATLSETSSSASSSASASSAASSSVASSSSASTSSASTSASASASASASSSSTTSSSSSSTSTSAPTTTPAAKQDPTPNAQVTKAAVSTAHQTIVKVDVTVSDPAAASTSTPVPTAGVSTTAKVSLAVIGAIAGSIGGVALIWTIIRKWKFRPSAEFEDRMQPINWQPADPNDDGLPSHRRSVASSFHSSGHDDSYSSRSGYGATSNSGHGIPEHDFTSGGPSLAPVGGYADLARGPSPQPYDSRGPSPPMQQVPAQYNHQLPLHYQNGVYGGEYDLGNGTTGPRY